MDALLDQDSIGPHIGLTVDGFYVCQEEDSFEDDSKYPSNDQGSEEIPDDGQLSGNDAVLGETSADCVPSRPVSNSPLNFPSVEEDKATNLGVHMQSRQLIMRI
jgi:hypothetical protein